MIEPSTPGRATSRPGSDNADFERRVAEVVSLATVLVGTENRSLGLGDVAVSGSALRLLREALLTLNE